VGVGGALSMGIGAFTSVRAQRQVRLSLLERIRLASRHAAHVLKKRIAGYMLRKGLSQRLSEMLAEEAARRPELMSSIVASEEYGLSEAALEDPVKAGLYTGIFYALGAVVPLLPYFAGAAIPIALPLSFFFAALMLAATGFIIAVSAGLSYPSKMLELVAAGLGSAILTFAIGRVASILLGINI
jgi:VIT1/CCC1 family predicted Fe2+/Mn2+ transporter